MGKTDANENGGAATASTIATGRQTEVAVLAGGCFWGVEDILRDVPGVIDTDVGYTGGWLENPTYDDTHDSKSGHAEAVRVTFDPTVLSYEDLLEQWFFRLHDPTTLNRQGNDVGTQYRSGIYWHDEAQKPVIERVLAEANAALGGRVVTEVGPVSNYSAAEAYHQHYFAQHPNQGYCAAVIGPKVEKFRKVFKERLLA